MDPIKLNLADGKGGMVRAGSYNFGEEISLEWIKAAAYMADIQNKVNFNLGLQSGEDNKNIKLKLGEIELTGKLEAGIDIQNNATIVAERIQRGGAKNHKRKVRKKTNKKRRKKTNKKRRISKSRNRKHNIRKSNTRKRNTRKRY